MSKAALATLSLAVGEFQKSRPLAASKLFADAAESPTLMTALAAVLASDVGVVPSEPGEELRELPGENCAREVQTAAGDEERIEVQAGANGWNYDKRDPAFSEEPTLTRSQENLEFYVAFLAKGNGNDADSLEIGYFDGDSPASRQDDMWEHVNADAPNGKLTDEDLQEAEVILKAMGCSAMPDRAGWNTLIGRLELSAGKRPSLFKPELASVGEDERIEVEASGDDERIEVEAADEGSNVDDMPSREVEAVRARARFARALANIQASLKAKAKAPSRAEANLAALAAKAKP